MTYINRLMIAVLALFGAQLHPHGFDDGQLVKTSFSKNVYHRMSIIHYVLHQGEEEQWVGSYDFKTGKCAKVKVIGSSFGISDHYFIMRFGEHSPEIRCTFDQEFWVPALNKWVPACKLHVGDKLLSEGKNAIPITYINLVKKPIEMYWIKTEGTHNYLVGYESILTHNAFGALAPVGYVMLEWAILEGAAAGSAAGAWLGPVTITAGATLGAIIGGALAWNKRNGMHNPEPMPGFSQSTYQPNANDFIKDQSIWDTTDNIPENPAADGGTKEKPKAAAPESDSKDDKKPNAQKPGKQPRPQTDDEIKRGIKSKEKLIKEHEQKLKDYAANPDAHDHKGVLKGKTREKREEIIKSRKDHLKQEIREWKEQNRKSNEKINANNGKA
jgi:hypothetical protein